MEFLGNVQLYRIDFPLMIMALVEFLVPKSINQKIIISMQTKYCKYCNTVRIIIVNLSHFYTQYSYLSNF